MKTPHKHAALIKAWADGADIEYWSKHSECWVGCGVSAHTWNEDQDYRIKPEPKPDVVSRLRAEIHHGWPHIYTANTSTNLKLTFDGETGKLKAAEVIA